MSFGSYLTLVWTEHVPQGGCDLKEDIARLVLVADRRVAQDLQMDDGQVNETQRFENSDEFGIQG